MSEQTTTAEGISPTSFEDVVIEKHAENARQEIQRERNLTDAERKYRDATAARDTLAVTYALLSKDTTANKNAMEPIAVRIKELDNDISIAESYMKLEADQRRQAEWEAAETERLEKVAKEVSAMYKAPRTPSAARGGENVFATPRIRL